MDNQLILKKLFPSISFMHFCVLFYFTCKLSHSLLQSIFMLKLYTFLKKNYLFKFSMFFLPLKYAFSHEVSSFFKLIFDPQKGLNNNNKFYTGF
jgi:hypothetical protein